MKHGITFGLAVIVTLAPAALAQRRPPAGLPSTGNSAPAAAPTAPANNSSSASLVNAGDTNGKMWDSVARAMDNGDFSADSENGIFTWKGSKFDVGNNLLVRSRFERYLSSPGFTDHTQDYQGILKQIQDLLSTDSTSQDAGDKVYQAWQLLGKAKQFPEDGGASETLANQVFNAWRVRDELAINRDKYDELDTLRRGQESKSAIDAVAASKAEVNNAIEFAKGNPGLTHPTGKGAQGIGADGQNTTQNTINKPGGGGNTSGNSTPPPSTIINLNDNSPNATSGGDGNGNNAAATGDSNGNTKPSGGGSGDSGSGGSGSGGGGSGGGGGGSGGGGLAGGSVGIDSSGPHIQFNAKGMPIGGTDGGAGAPTALPTLQNTNFAGLDAVALARTYARQYLLDADSTTMGLQAKLQYQTQLVAFIAERRFQHSLIAGQFYEHIFKGSQQRMNVAKEEISKFIDTDSIVPSVNSFEFISHEAIADVDNSMKTVENAYDTGDRWTALQQLQQTFLIGEMLPSVQDFDPAKRKVLLAIYRASTDLKHMMDMHDFGAAETTVKKIQADAQDFQAGPILSAIQSGEQTSNLALMAAQQAAVAGDTDRFTTNMEKATEIWPLNPDIKKFSKTMLDKGDLTAVGSSKFDELLSHGDDRAIFDNRDELGLAVYQDTDRAAKLKDVLHRMGQVEMMIAYSDQAMKQNNGYAAWEALISASAIEPNDPVLARSKAQVAVRVAPFVSALDSADRAEKAGDYAAALNYYLEAQDIYPASQICHDAIDNLSMKVMAKLNPGGPSAKAFAAQQAADKAAAMSSTPATTPDTVQTGTPATGAGSKSLF